MSFLGNTQVVKLNAKNLQKLHFQKKTKNDAAIKWASRNFSE